MAELRESVLLYMQSNNLERLKEVLEGIRSKIKGIGGLLNEDVIASKLSEGTLFRDISSEAYIPSAIKGNVIAIQSTANGNCLFSSASILLVGNNSLSLELRIATSIELFLNMKFYSQHPLIVKIFKSGENTFFSYYKNMVCVLVSHAALDAAEGKTAENLIKEEALYVLNDKAWCGFLCILSLSSVLGHRIKTFYPECGLDKLKFLFNQTIEPRISHINKELHILFCFLGDSIPSVFKHNHYVPLCTVKLKDLRKSESKSQIPRKYKIVEPFKTVSNGFTTSKKMKLEGHLLKTQSKIPYKPMPSKIPLKIEIADTKSTHISNLRCTESENINRTLNSLNKKSSLSCNTKSFSTTSSTCAATSSTKNIANSINNSRTAINNTINNSKISSHYTAATNDAATTTTNSVFNTNTIKKISTIKELAPSVNCLTPSIVSGNDIATFFDKAPSLSDGEILQLAKSVFVPDPNYKFPKNKFDRSFNCNWLREYCWLKYSPSANGGYCLPCVLLSHKFPALLSNCKNFITQAVEAKPSTSSLLKLHNGKTGDSKKSLHKETSALLNTLFAQEKGTLKPIDEMINEQLTIERANNRKLLIPIIDTILLCGRLGIALRGHRDDIKFNEFGGYSLGNIGNFLEIINYRARANPQFKEALDNAAKNARYLSKTAQNDLINCIGTLISSKLVASVKKAKFFTVLGDECMDASGKEQFSLCLRFVNEKYEICEKFVKFIHCNEGLSGEALCNVVLKCISDDLQLDIKNCRGQGYDGAGAVAGIRSGLSARILKDNSKAIYTHCYSHRLNLSICATCNMQVVKNVLEQIKDIAWFFRSSETRQRLLEEVIKIHVEGATIKKLFDPCRTRWVEKINALHVFSVLYVAIVYALEEMHFNKEKKVNVDTSSKATIHLKNVTSFDFIAVFTLLKNVFVMTKDVTKLLQKRSNEIIDGIHLIESLKVLAKTSRTSVDHYHEKWYGEAVSLAEKINVEEKTPRIPLRQNYRSTVPYANPSDYYKKSITIPLLDHLVRELDTRFNTSALVSYKGLSAIPSKMIASLEKQKSFKKLEESSWRINFREYLEFYFDDLPAYNLVDIEHEMDLWEHFWETFPESLPNNISSTLKFMPSIGFDNIRIALQIMATLPVTSCECERSFSAMKLLKTNLRTTMTSERFNGLALMYQHKDIIPSVEEVIKKFSEKRRRLDFWY